MEKERTVMREPPLAEMRGIHKWFGKIHAVDDASFTVRKGEVVGMVGDNGAGKSTLIRILAGYHRPDNGEIFVEGRKVKIDSPSNARALKIETVYQDQALVGLMSVARNIFMGREPVKRAGFLDKEKMNNESMKILRDMGLSIKSPNDEVKFLSGGEKQGTAIARAMYFEAKLVILDEPTATLSVKEAQTVLEFVKRLKKENIAVIFITHNLYHVHPVADRFLVMRRGKIVKDALKKDTSVKKLTEAIIS